MTIPDARVGSAILLLFLSLSLALSAYVYLSASDDGTLCDALIICSMQS